MKILGKYLTLHVYGALVCKVSSPPSCTRLLAAAKVPVAQQPQKVQSKCNTFKATVKKIGPTLAAAFCAAAIMYPFDLVKALQMANANSGTKLSTVTLLNNFRKVHGISGFFTQGLAPELARSTWMRFLKFSIFPMVHKALHGISEVAGSPASKATAGVLYRLFSTAHSSSCILTKSPAPCSSSRCCARGVVHHAVGAGEGHATAGHHQQVQEQHVLSHEGSVHHQRTIGFSNRVCAAITAAHCAASFASSLLSPHRHHCFAGMLESSTARRCGLPRTSHLYRSSRRLLTR